MVGGGESRQLLLEDVLLGGQLLQQMNGVTAAANDARLAWVRVCNDLILWDAADKIWRELSAQLKRK